MRYVPEAILYNKGPETINDFLIQRRRNYAGHLHLKKNTGYSVSSMNLSNLIIVVRNINLTPKEAIFCVGAGILEVIGRILGNYDFHIKKTNHYIWDVVKTTRTSKNEIRWGCFQRLCSTSCQRIEVPAASLYKHYC